MVEKDMVLKPGLLHINNLSLTPSSFSQTSGLTYGNLHSTPACDVNYFFAVEV